MNYDKYLGVSYNNGSLELFENLMKIRILHLSHHMKP